MIKGFAPLQGLLQRTMGPATWGTVLSWERAEHLHKLQSIISPQVTQLSIFIQAPNWIFAKASQDLKLPLGACRYFALCG